MPIKVRSTFRKQEFEYESPDGEKWLINYVESEGRKYLSIGKDGQDEKDFTVWDVPMLLDIADQVRSLTSRITNNKTHRHQLKSPVVRDHRNEISERSDQIESHVETSMSNYDDDVPPMESFSPPSKDEWFKVRSGVDLHTASAEVGETPDDFKRSTESPDWIDRSKMPRPRKPNITKGAHGDKFKRVGAGDII